MSKEIYKNLNLKVEEGIFIVRSFFKGIFINIFLIKKDKDVLLIDSGILNSFTMIKEVLKK